MTVFTVSAVQPTKVLFVFVMMMMMTFCMRTADAQQCNVEHPEWIGDGYCDASGGYNKFVCGWDGGDCCQISCVDGPTYDCGENGYDCLDPNPQSKNPTSATTSPTRIPTPSPTVTTISPTLVPTRSPTPSPTYAFYTGNWITSNENLPIIQHKMPGGYWNGTVSMFGGYELTFPNYYMEYNLSADTAMDLSASVTDTYLSWGEGQFYTQEQHKLFIISPDSDADISLFDLSTKNYVTDYAALPERISWMYGGTGCLTSTTEFLYVVGGYDIPYSLNYLQILVLDSLEWQEGPSLITGRRSAACGLSNNGYLFAIGGYYVQSIERINLQNIFSNEWQEFGELMGQTTVDGRTAVVYGPDILVIGGRKTQIINTLTGVVEFGPAMNIPVLYAVVVLAQNKIYAFGGYDIRTSSYVDIIQYYILPETSAPTSAPTAAPTSLTLSPTVFPTVSPTNPTNVPTTAPSNAPSLAPSQAPTVPTNSPSDSPSTPPTQSPSSSPSQPPSMHPSEAPSQSPSSAPSQPPSMHPSVAPSKSPSASPTQPPSMPPSPAPTNNPTRQPTANPAPAFTSPPSQKPSKSPTTGPPTISPTSSPTAEPTLSAEMVQYLQDVNELETLYQRLLIVSVSVFVIIAGIAWIDSTNKCRTNDYFKINQMSGAAFQSLDMLSDCFFAVNVSYQNNIDSQYSMTLVLSIVFVIVPAALTIFQLYYHSKKHWIYSTEKVRGWMAKRAKALYFLSLVTGNAFSAVSLVNSYMFQLNFFDMGLTDKDLAAFMYKRVYTVILFENIPQLAIQTWYLVSFGAFDDPITISSIVFSMVSIIVSVLSMSVQRSISRTDGHVAVTMQIKGDAVVSKAKHCKTMKKKLEKKLAEIVCVEPSRVQVIKPINIKHGFELNVNFYFLDVNKTPIDYYKILVDAKQKNELQIAFQEGWKLHDQPSVDIISHQTTQSKDERRRSRQSTNKSAEGAIQLSMAAPPTTTDGGDDQPVIQSQPTSEKKEATEKEPSEKEAIENSATENEAGQEEIFCD